MRSIAGVLPIWLLCSTLTMPALGSPGSAEAVRLPAMADRGGPGALPLYGLARPSVSDRGCHGHAYRGFDFWLGRWDVYARIPGDTAEKVVGTNAITSALNGCALEEHWTDALGGRGRSLNTYDAGTGEWNQLWTDATGLALIFAGKATEGRVVMMGDTPKGVGGPIITNRGTWTANGKDRVRQVFEVSSDSQATWAPMFDGDYRKAGTTSPAVEVLSQSCSPTNRARYHWFDFLLGTWQVRTGGATGKSIGTMSVKKDLSDCLVETVFEGMEYQGKAYSAFHFPSLTWHRTWIDQDGVRIALTGRLENDAMVMRGQRMVGGMPQEIKATWQPISPKQVNETWEISTDGGTTWSTTREFSLTAD